MAKSNFIVRGGADFSSLNKALNQTQTKLTQFQTGVGKSLKLIGATFGALKIGQFIKESTQMSMGVESAVDNIKRNMGSVSAVFENFVNMQSKSLAMAKADAYKYGSVFSNLLGSITTNSTEVENKTESLMKAAAVISSKTGRTYEDVADRIRSGMLGSTEAIEDLGIYTNISMIESTNAFKKFAGNKSWSQLTYQQQQQIRLAAILEQAYGRYGDELANTTATKQAMFIASLKNIQLNLGQAFLPIYNAVLPALTSLANAIESITSKFASFTKAIFGKAESSENVQNQSDAVASLGDETEKAGKKAQKAQKALAGFDQLNILGSHTNGADAGTDTKQKNPDKKNDPEEVNKISDVLDKVKAKFLEIAALFSKGFNIGFGNTNFDGIVNSLTNIKNSLKSIFTDPSVVGAAGNWVNNTILSLGKLTGAAASIGTTVVELFIGSIEKYLSQNSDFLKSKIISIFDISSKISEITSGFATALADIFTVFKSDTAKQIGADLIAIFVNSFLSLTELALQFGSDLMAAITQPITDNKDAIKTALENTLKPIKTLVGGIKDFLTGVFESIKTAYDTYISPALKNFADGFSKVYKGVLDGYNQYLAPTIDKIVKKVVELLNQYIKPFIDKLLKFVGSLIEAISKFWNFISPFVAWIVKDFIEKMSIGLNALLPIIEFVFKALLQGASSAIDILQGLLDFIVAVFTGDWDKAWRVIVSAFDSIFGDFAKPIKDVLNGLISFIKNVFAGNWKGAWEVLKKTFSDVFGGLGDSIKTTLKGALNGVITIFNKFIGWVNSKLNFSWDGLKIAGKTIFDGGSVVLAKIPNIPQLAKGGIVDSPTLATIGEAGKEAIVPLENTAFVTTIASAIATEIAKVVKPANNSNGDVVLRIGETDFGRVAIKAINNVQRNAGTTLLEV